MGDDTISLLNWRKHTIGVCARHPEYPAQANTRVGRVNQALLWEWSLGERRQPSDLSHYAGQDVRRRWRHLVPSALDFISDGGLPLDRGSNNELRGVVLLCLKQNQNGESLDWVFSHVRGRRLSAHSVRATAGIGKHGKNNDRDGGSHGVMTPNELTYAGLMTKNKPRLPGNPEALPGVGSSDLV